MFKKIRNGEYLAILTDNTFIYYKKGLSFTPFVFSHELLLRYPNIKYLCSIYKDIYSNEYFKIIIRPKPNEAGSLIKISKEQVHKELKLLKYQKDFDKHLGD